VSLIPEFHFLDASLTREQREKAIDQWVEKQVKRLLAGGPVKINKMLLDRNDFIWLSHIIENRRNSFLHEAKTDASKERLAIIAEKGFESVEYLTRLFDDMVAQQSEDTELDVV